MKKFFLPIFLILIWMPVYVAAQSEPSAVLEYYEDPYGDMKITDDTGTALDYFDMGEQLPPGFSISTGGGFAEIRLYPNGTILKLAENTDFSITNLQGYRGSPSNEFSLLKGKLRTIAARTSGFDYYNVRTPTAVMGVRGTDFINEVGPAGANVTVREGLVEVIPFSGKSIMAGANQTVNTLADVFSAVSLPADQVGSLFRSMGFKALSPADVPGHTPLADSQEPAAHSTEEDQNDGSAVEPVETITEEDMAAAQEGKKEDKKPEKESKLASILGDIFGLEIGTTTIDGHTYSKVIVQPRIEAGKFKLGLYLPVIYVDNMFDSAQWYHPGGNDEWSFGTDQNGDLQNVLLDILKDTMLKIRYVEYGNQGWDPFYLKVGNLNDMSIGHGAIMSEFANDADFPAIRKIGLNMGFDLGVLGMEFVGDNLADPSIMGGRLFLNPFKGYDPFQLGFTGIVDLFPARGSFLGASYYGDPLLMAFGMDMEIFKINRDNFKLMLFGDISSMLPVFREDTAYFSAGVPEKSFWINNGTFNNYGVVAGLRGSVMSFQWALEFRLSTGIYKPTLFNALYDRNKIEYLNEIIAYIGSLPNTSAWGTTMGIYGEGGFTLLKKLEFSAGYYWPWEINDGTVSFTNDDKFSLTFAVTDSLIEKFPLYGSITYERTGLINTFKSGNVNLFDGNTRIYGELIYPVAPTLDIVLGASTATKVIDGVTQYEPDEVTPQVVPVINIETRIHF